MKRLLILLLVFPIALSAQKPAPQAGRQGRAYIDSVLDALANTKGDSDKISLLNVLATIYWAYNPDSGINFGQQELLLSQKLGLKKGMAYADMNIGVNYRYKSDYNKAMEYFRRSMRIDEETGDKPGIGSVYTNMCIVFIDQSDYTQALDCGFKSLNIYEESNDKIRIAKNLTNIGIIYDDQGDYSKALEYHSKALKMYQELNVQNSIAISLANIGLIYQEEKRYDTALAYHFRSLQICEAMGNKSVLSGVLGFIGVEYNGLRNYSSALEYFSRGLKIDEELGSKAGKAEKLANIGVTYLSLAKDTSRIKNDKPITGSKELSLKKAVEYLSEAIAIHKETGKIKDLSENYHDLSTAWELLGNTNAALENYKQYIAAKDSVFSNANKIKIANLETKRDLDLKDKQIEIDRLEVAKKRNEGGFFIAGIFLLMIIGILFINRQRLKQKKLEIEKKNAEAEKKNAEAELDTATKLLDSFRQSIQEKNSIIERFTNEIERMKQGETQQADTELLSQLENAIILTDEQWEHFRLLFEKVHKGFFTNLRKKMPDLTQAEIRFLALTKLKLTSKEMAAMLGISANAIRIYRHRLRRKLDLDKEDMIEELVENI